MRTYARTCMNATIPSLVSSSIFCLAWSIALILAAVLNAIVLLQNWSKSRNLVAKLTIFHVEKGKVLNVRQKQRWYLTVSFSVNFKNMEYWDWSTVLYSESESPAKNCAEMVWWPVNSSPHSYDKTLWPTKKKLGYNYLKEFSQKKIIEAFFSFLDFNFFE